MERIDGNKIARSIIEELKTEVAKLEGAQPTIAFVRVGEDPASVAYVNKKQRVANEIGMRSILKLLPIEVPQEELFSVIDKLNNDKAVHGILIQAPLPKQISEREAFNRVLAEKDVDGFSVTNLGKLCQEDESGFIACTPAGICELLVRSEVETKGKHVVVLGRSLIVGKPAALLMMQKGYPGDATVTVCHSRTLHLEKILKQADIVIAAMGKPGFVTGSMLKKGAVIIDVGISRIEDPSKKSGYRLAGDVDFESTSKIASKLTPVPGGVGPMTVAMLMKNTLKAYKQQMGNA